MVAGTCHLQGSQPIPWGRSSVSFKQIGQTSFFSRWLHLWFGTFTHTCTVPQGRVAGTCHLQGRSAPTMGQVPCEFQADQPTFIFQPAAPDMIWHIYFGQGWRYGPAIFRGCCTHQGTCRGPSPDQGAPPLKTASGWYHNPLSSTARSKCAKSCQELLAEKWRLADLLKTHRGPVPW